MRVAVTRATGFIGRYIVQHLADQGHSFKCWHRPSSHRDGFEGIAELKWIEGDLGDRESALALVDGCDAVIHAALYRPGAGFRGAEGDIVEFVQKNVVGTLELIEAARNAKVDRFVFISTCAVHEKILDDCPLAAGPRTVPRPYLLPHRPDRTGRQCSCRRQVEHADDPQGRLGTVQ